MPAADGSFKGQGWSAAKAAGWELAFGSRPLQPDTIAEIEAVPDLMAAARSVLDDPCECAGDPPTYEYRKDRRQHCAWCDGLAGGR